MPDCLTNSSLPLLCCRHVEDICLVACVGFVVGLNVNGELLNKGAGVSEGQEATKWSNKQTVPTNQEECIVDWHLPSLRDLLLNCMAQDQNYFIKSDNTLTLLRIENVWAMPICCIWGVCSKAVTGWIDVSTGTCSLSISWQYSQGHISFQHLHVSVFVKHHADKHTDTLRMRGHQHLTAWERCWPHADLMVCSIIFWQPALRSLFSLGFGWRDSSQSRASVRASSPAPLILCVLHWIQAGFELLSILYKGGGCNVCFLMDSSDNLKWGCMIYLLIVSILAAVDAGWHTPILEKQRGVSAQKLRYILWTGTAARYTSDT